MTIGDSSHDLTLVDVLVVVVTYNSEDVLDGFFASLPGAFADVSSCRVVVSDNASADASIDMARRLWPEALIVSSPVNRGYAAAINAAVANGGPSRSVLILNDDIRLGLGSVRRLLDALEGEPDIGITVPRLLDGDGQLVKSLRREPTPMRVLGEAVLGGDRSGRWAALGSVVQDPSVYAVPHDVTWASGCAWLVSRSCWDTVGEWDESLFLYSEDVDYALRARDAGIRMRYVPSVSVVHLAGPAHRDPRLWSMSVWNRYRLYARRHGRVASAAFRGALLVNETLRALAGREVHKAGALALISESRRPEEVR